MACCTLASTVGAETIEVKVFLHEYIFNSLLVSLLLLVVAVAIMQCGCIQFLLAVLPPIMSARVAAS